MQHMLAESTFEMFTRPETITVSVTDRSRPAVRASWHFRGKLRLNVTQVEENETEDTRYSNIGKSND